MIQVPFGENYIEVDDDKKPELEDLSHSPTNKIILGLVNDQCLSKHEELRSAVSEGNLGKAQESNGYIKALEDISAMLSEGLSGSLKE